MKYYIAILMMVFISCTHGSYEHENVVHDGKCVPLSDYYRQLTGYDSVQIIFGGRGKYNEKKHNYDVTWDSLYTHFCYANKWQTYKFKKDTVFVHDTVLKKYTSIKYVYLNSETPYSDYDTINVKPPLYSEILKGMHHLKSK